MALDLLFRGRDEAPPAARIEPSFDPPAQKDGASIEAWFSAFGGGARTASGLVVNQLSAMQASAVMACVSILSEDLAKLPLHLYRQTSGGGKVIAADHPVERLLQKPNAWQTRFEFIETAMACLLLRGVGYAAILRDSRGRPTALVPVNPDRVFRYFAPDGSIFYMVARQNPHDIAVLSSLPLMVHQDDMFVLRWLSLDGITPLSRVGSAREAISLNLAQQEQAGRWARNGAQLSGTLATDQKLSEDVAKRVAESWRSNFSGIEATGKTPILEQGLKWAAMQMTSVDAEFLASRKFGVEEIARIFRMPVHKLAISERSTNQTMAQADQDYVNNTLTSYVERCEAKIDDTFGLANDGVFAQFDLSRFLRADITARYAAGRTGVIGSLITPNEWRRGEGLPDMEGGDTLYQPTNMAPLGFMPAGTESGPGSDLTGAPGAGGDGDPAALPPDEAPTG